jgi:hypothetical protein
MMLQQAAEAWSSPAIHDTVATLLRDRAYHRSFWSSLIGRILSELGRLLDWIYETARSMPGGRTAVIVIVVAILLLILARVFMTAAWRDDGHMRRRGSPGRVTRTDPWSEAESLAAAGDYLAAAHALYQAVLRRIAGAERIRLHPSKTSGDYARELRRRDSPLTGPFQRFGRRFDRVVFGVGECSPEEFAAMLRDASMIAERQAAA